MIIASLILGTYALTLAITESAGPWGVLEKLRRVKWIESFGLLECSTCVAFWTALGLCMAFGRLDLYFIAVGGSVLLGRLIIAHMLK